MVTPSGKLELIDLSRLRDWPIGYDLSRLSTMLRLRLALADEQEDWFPESLARCYCEPVANIDAQIEPESSLCPAAVYCDQAFRGFLETVDSEHRPRLEFGYRLGVLWDLVKVISYIDISPFKRVWATLECLRLKRRLEADLSKVTNAP